MNTDGLEPQKAQKAQKVWTMEGTDRQHALLVRNRIMATIDEQTKQLRQAEQVVEILKSNLEALWLSVGLCESVALPSREKIPEAGNQ